MLLTRSRCWLPFFSRRQCSSTTRDGNDHVLVSCQTAFLAAASCAATGRELIARGVLPDHEKAIERPRRQREDGGEGHFCDWGFFFV